MKIAWTELIKFFKNNIYKLITGTVLVALIFAGLSFVFGQNSIDDLNDDIEIEGINPQAKQANFRYYIEDSDNDIFTNSLLIEEYFLTPELLEQAAIETNTNLVEIIEGTENTSIVTETEYTRDQILGVARDGSTQIQQFYINLGNERNNLDLANYFYNLLIEDEIPFLEDKTVYILQEPEILELDEGKQNLAETSDMDEATYNLLQNLIVGSLFGLIATTLILFIFTLFSKKLAYSFSYSTLEQDIFFLVDKNRQIKDDLVELLTLPKNARKVVIHQHINEGTNNVFDKIMININDTENIEVVNNFLEIEKPNEIDRLIYVINENTTSRKWYNKQRRLGKNLEITTMILHINKD